ncbi:MAG: SDR family oxidoreductase [Planctomycetota bacterium]|jgi:nucleoside-diphosphate-sugar epimerase
MAVFITGGTGYIGSYVVAGLLERSEEPLFVLARQADPPKLWRALQLHLEPEPFRRALRERITLLDGDITEDRLGLEADQYERLCRETTSVIHIAASLNRKSEKSCLNVNLRGTLEVCLMARQAHADHGLARFSHVSTVAVAGRRQDEVVREDDALDWDRSDYDPYARTKKFCEHLLRKLLPDVPRTILRPSVVLGDSRRPETTQFDMVRAFAFLARMPVLPLRGEDRIDIVPADYVADAIVALHLAEQAPHEIYHLSAGADAQTYGTITAALAEARKRGPPWFWSWLDIPFDWAARALGTLQGTGVGRALTYNTVFDNRRVVEALGREPTPFTEYCSPLLSWSLEHKFQYPYREYPQ